MGDVKTPFYIVLVTVVLNFLADPILIMGLGASPPIGWMGAAYSTVATQGIAAVLGMYLLAKGKGGIRLNFRSPEVNFRLIKQILNLGLPSCAEQSARALAMMVMTFLVGQFWQYALGRLRGGRSSFEFYNHSKPWFLHGRVYIGGPEYWGPQI